MQTDRDTDPRTPLSGESNPEANVAAKLTVTGTVQGVGFRPFVAQTAAVNNLAGRVQNTDAGVEIEFEGPAAAVARAVETVRTDPPRLARIEEVRVAETTPHGREAFEIIDSTGGEDRTALVPPDTAICADCLAELRDPDSRFHEYWATGCTDCGPRFAVTRGLPYDRERTSLSGFEPCGSCRADYEDRTARRFHAQVIACPDCGPGLSLVESDGATAATGVDAVEAAAARLRAGETVAVKGAGGCHLACQATDESAVGRLRADLGRPGKPFATMAPSLSAVREFATVSETAAEALTGRRRPIVLLPRDGPGWLDTVAPGLGTVGVMLPYSGLHHLLFDRLPADPLVMTSANRPGAPMATTREKLLALDAVDAALVHDRPVVNRCDDSVVRVVNGDRRLLRRSRGFVPRPLDRPVLPDAEVLAVGGATDVTTALTREDEVVASQHIGDVSAPATVEAHRAATDRLQDLLGVDPEVIAHDHHPDYETTGIARRRPEPTVAVQHHHAHAASLLAEHDRERAVVVAADGTGYGPSGVVRGGEVLDAGLADYDRVGGLGRFRLPGGSAAVERPARTAAALLADRDRERAVSLLVESGEVPARPAAETLLSRAVDDGDSPVTTSAGRFLDAVAALTGICTERRYQGEPAMRLEAAAADGNPVPVDVPTAVRDGQLVVDAAAAMRDLATLAEDRPAPDVAATAQRVLAAGLAEVALTAAADRGLDAVGFTGGVAYNPRIDRHIRHRVQEAGYAYLGHDEVPPGDAGLAYGQAVVASARLATDEFDIRAEDWNRFKWG